MPAAAAIAATAWLNAASMHRDNPRAPSSCLLTLDYFLYCSVPHAGAAAGSTPPLSGLDLQDSWSASGLASSISAAQLKPSLSMRPITTHVNVLLAGSGHYLGKAPYYSNDSCTASSAADTAAAGSTATAKSAATNTDASSKSATTNTPKSASNTAAEGPSKADQDAKSLLIRLSSFLYARGSRDASDGPGTSSSSSSSSGSSAPVDLHAAFLEDPAAWATQLPPVLLPEAGREMVYRFQVRRLHKRKGMTSRSAAQHHRLCRNGIARSPRCHTVTKRIGMSTESVRAVRKQYPAVLSVEDALACQSGSVPA
jgi:hypothetical protein